MSNVRRLRTTDRLFFVTVNLHKTVPHLTPTDFPLLVEALGGSRHRLGFALCGYVLMPDHWHALIWPHPPSTISQVIQRHQAKFRAQAESRSGHARPGLATSILGSLRQAREGIQRAA